ncbi:MAG: TRAP transporter small permease [Allorhizobium sp.]
MILLLNFVSILGRVNAALLAAGRWLGAVCVGLMVVIILIQVVFRYGLGNALPWSEEAARFLMLWMAGLMAPTAFRRGGFVAIDMVVVLLPRLLAGLLSVLLLVLSAIVLWNAMRIGWAEANGLGGRFAMSAIAVPTSLDLSSWMKVPRGWMMSSLAVGVTLMFAVNIELILRSVVSLFGAETRLTPIPYTQTLGAE